MPTWKASHSLEVAFKVAGGSYVTLNITGFKHKETGDVHDVTHTGTGGLQDLLAGVERGEYSVMANVDIDSLPLATSPGIKFGAKGMLRQNFGTATKAETPVMVKSVDYSSAVAGKFEYQFDLGYCHSAGTRIYAA